MAGVTRRELLASGALAGAAALSPVWLRDALAAPARAGAGPYGALRPPDANGLMLPAGFRSREVARGLQPVKGYSWPIWSDGQATFRTANGGWILVTNSESLAATGAGTSAIRFGPNGSIVSAYRILGGTNANCAGGPTPWGTWLSCEETDFGMVWECDPAGVLPAQPRPALGLFNHEAAAVDPVGHRLYLTEDESDGGFYRFTPTAYPGLTAGLLEVATVAPDGSLSWSEVPDPTTAETQTPTRQQVPGMTRFNGGEGIWYADDVLYFTTKGDKKVWAYRPREERIEVIFDRAQAQDSSLDAVDNVTVSSVGEVFVCEDGGNMEIGLITPDRVVSPFLRFTGAAHALSEVCGAVFDPSGSRLYFTSQGAYPVIPGQRGPGAVYEVQGPFRGAKQGGAPTSNGPGLPAGEARPRGPLNPGPDVRGPRLRIWAPRRVGRRGLVRRGLPLRVRTDERARVVAALRVDLGRRAGKGGSTARTRSAAVARKRWRLRRPGLLRARLRLGRSGRLRLRRRRRSLAARLIVVARDASGNRSTAVRRVRIGRAPGGR